MEPATKAFYDRIHALQALTTDGASREFLRQLLLSTFTFEVLSALHAAVMRAPQLAKADAVLDHILAIRDRLNESLAVAELLVLQQSTEERRPS